MVFIATVLLANRLNIKINKSRAPKAYYRCFNLTATSSVVWFKLLTICESIEGRVNRTWDRGEVPKIDRDLYLVEDVLGRERQSIGPASQKAGSLTHLKVARVVADQVAERHNTNDLARFCHD